MFYNMEPLRGETACENIFLMRFWSNKVVYSHLGEYFIAEFCAGYLWTLMYIKVNNSSFVYSNKSQQKKSNVLKQEITWRKFHDNICQHEIMNTHKFYVQHFFFVLFFFLSQKSLLQSQTFIFAATIIHHS